MWARDLALVPGTDLVHLLETPSSVPIDNRLFPERPGKFLTWPLDNLSVRKEIQHDYGYVMLCKFNLHFFFKKSVSWFYEGLEATHQFMSWRATCYQESISIHELVEGMSNRITGSTDANSFHHARISQLSTTQLSIKHLKANRTNDPKDAPLHMVQIPTIGFLNSFGLTHRTKKGLHWPKVCMSISKLFLNCDDKVGARFLVSDPMLKSPANICCKNRFLDTWINWRRSALNVSLFLSRKLLVS